MMVELDFYFKKIDSMSEISTLDLHCIDCTSSRKVSRREVGASNFLGFITTQLVTQSASYKVTHSVIQ
jgi:hypothetical protein